MFHWVDDDDPTPVGTMGLCITCSRAVIVDADGRHQFRMWKHFVPWLGGYHDPEPAPSIRDRMADHGEL